MSFLKRLVDLLAPLGFLLAVGVLAWTRYGKTLPGGLRPYLIAALALVLLHLILRWEDVARGLGRRQLKYGTNTAVLVLVVLGILGAANYLVVRHPKRFDLTKDQRYSLSDQTRKVVAGLKDDVKITYFQRQRDMARGQDRLKEYQALSPRLKVEFVDPVQSPAKAQAYDVRGPWPILVVEKADKRERVSNDGEQDITNALLKVTREGKKTVCLLEGEGERSGEETGDRGFSGAKAQLTKSLYDVKSVFLMREKAVPADCTVLVVGGPDKDLLPETTGAIRDFVKNGGKALVMVEAELKEHYPNLVALLKEWNIEAGSDVVVDVSGMGQLFGFSELAPLAIEYPWHPITKDFRLPTLYGGARSVQAGKGTAEGVSVQDLVKTSRPVVGGERPHPQGPDQVRRGQGPHGADLARRGGDREGARTSPDARPVARALARPRGAEGQGGPGGRDRRRRLRHELPPRLPGEPGLLPERGGLARRGRRPHLDPPEGAGEPGPLPEPPGPAERGLDRARPPARPLRDPGHRHLVAEAIGP